MGSLRNLAAAVMLGASFAMPRLGQQHRLTFDERPAPEYDGLGRKKRRGGIVDHNAKRRTKAWRQYAEKVEATHSVDQFGRFREDPRDDKYLHSVAREMRNLRRAFAPSPGRR